VARRRGLSVPSFVEGPQVAAEEPEILIDPVSDGALAEAET
jgi:hypothetical protein